MEKNLKDEALTIKNFLVNKCKIKDETEIINIAISIDINREGGIHVMESVLIKKKILHMLQTTYAL